MLGSSSNDLLISAPPAAATCFIILNDAPSRYVDLIFALKKMIKLEKDGEKTGGAERKSKSLVRGKPEEGE